MVPLLGIRFGSQKFAGKIEITKLHRKTIVNSMSIT